LCSLSGEDWVSPRYERKPVSAIISTSGTVSAGRLCVAMTAADVAVHEEAIVDPLLADLQ